MNPSCSNCGFRLGQFRLFSQSCKRCGSKHVARPGFSWLRGVFGILAPVLWFGCLFLPISMWMKLVGVPILLAAIGGWVTLGSQRWVQGSAQAS